MKPVLVGLGRILVAVVAVALLVGGLGNGGPGFAATAPAPGPSAGPSPSPSGPPPCLSKSCGHIVWVSLEAHCWEDQACLITIYRGSELWQYPEAVHAATIDDTAHGGVDFVGFNDRVVVFQAGGQEARLSVQLLAHQRQPGEPDRTFRVKLFNPSLGELGHSTVQVTIHADDPQR